ncbi:MAG TPA: NADH-quinone oxidoreductase subunit A, partial [Anaeromyxobacteraceae bacterium]
MGFEFAAVAAFAAMAVGFGVGGLTIGRILRPHFPETDKAITYECGELPIGGAWFNFNPRFYLIALVFVIFEVEIALTFPVVAVYKDWVARSLTLGLVALVELLLFTAILVLGLAWVW